MHASVIIVLQVSTTYTSGVDKATQTSSTFFHSKDLFGHSLAVRRDQLCTSELPHIREEQLRVSEQPCISEQPTCSVVQKPFIWGEQQPHIKNKQQSDSLDEQLPQDTCMLEEADEEQGSSDDDDDEFDADVKCDWLFNAADGGSSRTYTFRPQTRFLRAMSIDNPVGLYDNQSLVEDGWIALGPSLQELLLKIEKDCWVLSKFAVPEYVALLTASLEHLLAHVPFSKNVRPLPNTSRNNGGNGGFALFRFTLTDLLEHLRRARKEGRAILPMYFRIELRQVETLVLEAKAALQKDMPLRSIRQPVLQSSEPVRVAEPQTGQSPPKAYQPLQLFRQITHYLGQKVNEISSYMQPPNQQAVIAPLPVIRAASEDNDTALGEEVTKVVQKLGEVSSALGLRAETTNTLKGIVKHLHCHAKQLERQPHQLVPRQAKMRKSSNVCSATSAKPILPPVSKSKSRMSMPGIIRKPSPMSASVPKARTPVVYVSICPSKLQSSVPPTPGGHAFSQTPTTHGPIAQPSNLASLSESSQDRSIQTPTPKSVTVTVQPLIPTTSELPFESFALPTVSSPMESSESPTSTSPSTPLTPNSQTSTVLTLTSVASTAPSPTSTSLAVKSVASAAPSPTSTSLMPKSFSQPSAPSSLPSTSSTTISAPPLASTASSSLPCSTSLTSAASSMLESLLSTTSCTETSLPSTKVTASSSVTSTTSSAVAPILSTVVTVPSVTSAKSTVTHQSSAASQVSTPHSSLALSSTASLPANLIPRLTSVPSVCTAIVATVAPSSLCQGSVKNASASVPHSMSSAVRTDSSALPAWDTIPIVVVSSKQPLVASVNPTIAQPAAIMTSDNAAAVSSIAASHAAVTDPKAVELWQASKSASSSAVPCVRPELKVQVKAVMQPHGKVGIVIKWAFSDEELHFQGLVALYELYAVILRDSSAKNWGKVGSLAPLPLPMAATLTSVVQGQVYVFAVKAIFRNGTATFTESRPISP